MNALENLNPFDSALASAMTAGSATAPVSDPPVAVAVNSSSCGGVEGHAATMALTASERPAGDNGAEASASLCRPRAGIKPGPQDSISVSAISAEGGVPAGEIAPPNPPLVGTSNPELAEVSRADIALQRGTPSHSRSLGTRGKTDQASIEPAPMAPATPSPGVETPADALLSFAPAAFSFQPDFEKRFNEIMGHK